MLDQFVEIYVPGPIPSMEMSPERIQSPEPADDMHK
jgi:hypothetical protein